MCWHAGRGRWVPACAGMTMRNFSGRHSRGGGSAGSRRMPASAGRARIHSPAVAKAIRRGAIRATTWRTDEGRAGGVMPGGLLQKGRGRGAPSRFPPLRDGRRSPIMGPNGRQEAPPATFGHARSPRRALAAPTPAVGGRSRRSARRFDARARRTASMAAVDGGASRQKAAREGRGSWDLCTWWPLP